VARSLQASPASVELLWIGGHRGLESGVVPATGIPFRQLLLRSLRSVDPDVHVVLDPIRLSLSVPQALALLAWYRPAAIFTTGGYVSMPALLAASLMRIPVVMWDGNAVPGRSVRVTARLAGSLAVSFERTRKALGRVKHCYVTGTPIRGRGAITRAGARAALGLQSDDRLLLIFGGSQAVRRFNAAVSDALSRLVEKARVVHVTGDAGYEEAMHGRDGLAAALRDRYTPERFLGEDEMTRALAAADLVVGRAGASTLAEVAAFGLPMVVVPYPHAAGHQRINAEEAVRAGAARLVEDESFDAEALLAAAAILDDGKLHHSMAAAARSLARPGAAGAVAELVLAAARREPAPDAASVEALAREAAG
jgi:UDP-N-acetylglucosamine:LPS N-acetylglucosamine transferase